MLEYLCRYISTYVKAGIYKTQLKDWPIGSAVHVSDICFHNTGVLNKPLSSELQAPRFRRPLTDAALLTVLRVVRRGSDAQVCAVSHQ